MSMVQVREAFTNQVADKGVTVLGATMTYEDGGKNQRLNFLVQKPDGTKEMVTESVPANVNLATKASEMGAALAASIGA